MIAPPVIIKEYGYVLNDYKVIKETPYANVLITDFAKDLIINENLGSDNDVDLLSVSYSFLLYCNVFFDFYDIIGDFGIFSLF